GCIEIGFKKNIIMNEESDHSLPYKLTAAYLDGDVMPEQYEPDRITRNDIQTLLQKVDVTENPAYSERFPNEMACKLTIETNDGKHHSIEKHDYEGFQTRPAKRDTLMKKYNKLTEDRKSTRLNSSHVSI